MALFATGKKIISSFVVGLCTTLFCLGAVVAIQMHMGKNKKCWDYRGSLACESSGKNHK